jgi:hypothetical protein
VEYGPVNLSCKSKIFDMGGPVPGIRLSLMILAGAEERQANSLKQSVVYVPHFPIIRLSSFSEVIPFRVLVSVQNYRQAEAVV